MKIQYSAGSDVGIMRESNEDALLVDGEIFRDGTRQGERLLDSPFFVVVADGMGGHDFGEVASERALEIFQRELKKIDWSSRLVRSSIETAVLAAHFALLRLLATHGNLGTTLCGLLFASEKKVFMVNVGDSRLYRLRAGRLRQLSRDHTWRTELQNPTIPGNWLTSVVGGGGDEIKIDVKNITSLLHDGDTLLLCSDGLSEYNPEDEIGHVLRENRETPHEELIRMALARGGQDNISVIVLHLQKSERRPH
jgi:serine/threonine protein phosphatase PrpC